MVVVLGLDQGSRGTEFVSVGVIVALVNSIVGCLFLFLFLRWRLASPFPNPFPSFPWSAIAVELVVVCGGAHKLVVCLCPFSLSFLFSLLLCLPI